MPELDVDASARLCVALESNTTALQRQRTDRQRVFEDVSLVPDIAFSTASLPYAPPSDGFGPSVGFWWAVQRLTLSGFGATTDFVTAYRSSVGVAGTVANKAAFTFQVPVVGGVSTWHPGRTGWLLCGKSQDSIALAGTFTGSTLYASVDVIQFTDEQLAYFLL